MKNKIKKLLGALMVIVCSFMFTNCFKSVDNSTNEPKPPIEEEKQENQEVAKPLEKMKEEKVTEIKKQEKKEKQVVYRRRNNNESYDIHIQATRIFENAELQFTKNGLFLTVFTGEDPNDVPDDVLTYDLAKEYAKLVEEEGANYKVYGDTAYKIDFDDGDFGIAFLVEDEDNRRLAVYRYTYLSDKNWLDDSMQIIKFKDSEGEYTRPNMLLIKSIKVENNKKITIEYGDGSHEYYKIEPTDTFGYEKKYYNLIEINKI